MEEPSERQAIMNWRTARRIVCACTIAASAVSVGLWTAQASARTPYLPQAAASANADVDPAAVKKLEKMGGYLRTLKAFQVQSVTSRDSVLVGGTVDMLVQRRPDRLRAEVTSDLRKSIRSPLRRRTLAPSGSINSRPASAGRPGAPTMWRCGIC